MARLDVCRGGEPAARGWHTACSRRARTSFRAIRARSPSPSIAGSSTARSTPSSSPAARAPESSCAGPGRRPTTPPSTTPSRGRWCCCGERPRDSTSWGAPSLHRRCGRFELSLRAAGAVPDDADRDLQRRFTDRGLGHRRRAFASARGRPRRARHRAHALSERRAVGLPRARQPPPPPLRGPGGPGHHRHRGRRGRHGSDPRALHRLVHPDHDQGLGLARNDRALRDRGDDRPPAGRRRRPARRDRRPRPGRDRGLPRRRLSPLPRSSPTRQNKLGGAFARARGLPEGRACTGGRTSRAAASGRSGPTRSFKTLPSLESETEARIAIGSCAAQFGPAFDAADGRPARRLRLAGRPQLPRHPRARWRKRSPATRASGATSSPTRRMSPLLERTHVRRPARRPRLRAPGRQLDEPGARGASSRGGRSWSAASSTASAAGAAEFWVLDQRRFKSDPEEPDTPEKTLLGARQRRWLLRTLKASPAAFKVICSPCTLAPAATPTSATAAGPPASPPSAISSSATSRGTSPGARSSSPATPTGRMAYESDGLFEVRPCPLGIPTPNDITLTNPNVAEEARAHPGRPLRRRRARTLRPGRCLDEARQARTSSSAS